MEEWIYVGSVSRAMQAKRLLEQHGVRAYVRQTSGTGGCGYGLLIPSYSKNIAALLRANGVVFHERKGRDAP